MIATLLARKTLSQKSVTGGAANRSLTISSNDTANVAPGEGIVVVVDWGVSGDDAANVTPGERIMVVVDRGIVSDDAGLCYDDASLVDKGGRHHCSGKAVGLGLSR